MRADGRDHARCQLAEDARSDPRSDVGDALYVIANSGWGEYDQQGRKKAGSAPVESTIRKIAL
jgi:hypothetical protein